jgi:hypothetical protein
MRGRVSGAVRLRGETSEAIWARTPHWESVYCDGLISQLQNSRETFCVIFGWLLLPLSAVIPSRMEKAGRRRNGLQLKPKLVAKDGLTIF